jgi:threonine/homoserine/homoserine lactone efflux protein
VGCWVAPYFVSLIPLITTPEESAGTALWIFLLATLLMLLPFLQMALWIVGGWWGAARALQGREFRYVVVGRYLERWLAKAPVGGPPAPSAPDNEAG